MPTTQVRIPKLCKHKATGQAVVRLDGKDHYLGQFGTASATAAYERWPTADDFPIHGPTRRSTS